MNLELPPALDRATALCEQGRLAEAEAICRRALAADLSDAEALHLLGVIALQQDDADAAVRLMEQAAAAAPGEPKYCVNLSAVLGQVGRNDEALATAREAAARHPDFPEAHNSLGSALVRADLCEDALGSYMRAIVLRPGYDEAFYNRGVAQQMLRRPEAAIACFQQAILLQPDYVEAYNQLGVAQASLRRFDAALAAYDHAIALDPEYDEAFYNRGVALQTMERHAEAIESYSQAIALRPDYAEAVKNRGMVLQAVERCEDALADYDRAIALRPEHGATHFSKAACLLQSGDLAHGWPEYEWRWQMPDVLRREFEQPLWDGRAPIAGKTILLHGEQGLGDTIQFSRLVAQVAARDARIVLEVAKPLVRLLASLPGVTETVARGDDLPPFDLHCPLLSLPVVLGVTLDAISGGSYLAADAALAVTWRQRLAPLTGLRVGLVWSGTVSPGADARRSMELDRLAPLAAVRGISFASLQKDAAAAQVRTARGLRPLDFTNYVADFADTAALVEALDLVISVDTSVAHLAGAMGKPVWLLLRFDACWRWLRGRDDSPWYPTARLFRQTAPGDWDGVVRRVAAALRDHAGDQIGAGSA
jgi:tetratricopeptide (TPR) repeat protein